MKTEIFQIFDINNYIHLVELLYLIYYIFRTPSRAAVVRTQPALQRVPGVFPWDKAAGAWS